MKKLGFILGATCAAVIAVGGLTASRLAKQPERDARIIVEVNRNVKSLSKQGIRNSQDAVLNNIMEYATTNVRRTKCYNELNNAFVLEVNSNDIERIREVPGVASVTLDEMHWKRTYNNDGFIALDAEGRGSEGSVEENISAATMHKPDDTFDGEGTLVAILDNEFHLRGKTDTTEEWHHEVYNALDSNVGVRYTYRTIKNIVGLNAAPVDAYVPGEGYEGSRYLNSKVPFYFDYGGESLSYGKPGEPKYDVHSDLSYHGSHVSSITAANAPTYKGIAPKAQLALMKVFTDYNAKDGIGETIGLTNSTGAYDTVILSALEDCIKLKVDGINMSLGSDLDDFDGDSITLRTLKDLANAGILSAISAGNSGKSSFSSTGAYANWTTSMVETGIMSSYANNANTMTIASGHPTRIFYENAFTVPDEKEGQKNIAFEDQIVNRPGMEEDYRDEFRVSDLFANTQSLEYQYVPGFGTFADYGTLDCQGKIVVVNRGSTSFADKYATAVGQGAKALVIINNDPTASDFNFRCSFGDGFNPTMPCALVLFKDKEYFVNHPNGQFGIIHKQVSDNPNAYTTSSFSTDGATFDLDLKPEITAPGDNIKGAVPEHAMTSLTQDEIHSAEYWHRCYQYLSGTSMSAPNYAGAQSVVLSKVAGPIYHNAKLAGRTTTQAEKDQVAEFRRTVDMRLMSTADPMTDGEGNENPETNVRSLISPRIQGAGMADLAGALSTDVYLEGLDLKGNKIGKAKVALRNNPDIAKGDIKLSFLAHNESAETRNYDVTLTVMRPALAQPNNIVTKDYNFKGEIDDIKNLSGMAYFDTDVRRMEIASGSIAYKDAVKASKDIEYYATEEAWKADQADIAAGKQPTRKTVIKQGYYYNAANEGVDWQPLPSFTAQSTKDVVIAEVKGQTVSVAPGESTITINPYSLTADAKKKILDNYEYGCMIEGFVTLKSKDNKADLSIPYLGFYSGADKNADATYDNAPVTEPFSFEKDITKVYPSDLVNDITKSLIGKDNVNFESMIVAGYVERPQLINKDSILSNDSAFDKLSGFFKVGTDPLTDEYTANPGNDIYVGSSKTSNTMIIQQFVLRSVIDNYFSLTNKETGKVVFQSALEDMLFGDTLGKWSLYKSHVDANYLSAGYVAHRAFAVVPLFNEVTGEAFASGEYELKFNYQLAGTGNWVSKSYTIHIDGEAPVVETITEYKDANGVNQVRAYFKEEKMSHAFIGNYIVDVNFDADKNMYYAEATKEFVDNAINEMSGDGDKRLFIGGVDYARGTSGCVVHFNNYDNFLLGYQMIQGADLDTFIDFRVDADNKVTFVDLRTGENVQIDSRYVISNFDAVIDYNPDEQPVEPAKKGCNGAIASLSLILGAPALLGASLLFFKKKKGGK